MRTLVRYCRGRPRCIPGVIARSFRRGGMPPMIMHMLLGNVASRFKAVTLIFLVVRRDEHLRIIVILISLVSDFSDGGYAM